MRTGVRSGSGGRRGAVVIETAIVLPLFFALVLGMVEMARLGLAVQLLTSAAEAGCRVAVINGKTQTDVNNAVSAILTSGGISTSSSSYASTITTNPVYSTPANITLTHRGDSITLQLSIAYRDISWLTPQYLGSSTISSSATLSSERP